ARSVSRPVATVDVVGAERHAGELLRKIVHFVGGLRAAEDPESVGTARIDVASEPFGRAIERRVPRTRLKRPVHADQGLGKTRVTAVPHANSLPPALSLADSGLGIPD